MAYQPADATLGGEVRRITVVAMGDPGIVTPAGQPIVVQGRLADAEAPGEVVINEVAARTAGLRLGDHVEVRWLAPDDVGDEGPASGPRLSLQIVGIIRAAFDLAASLSDGAAEAFFFTGPGTWRAVEDEAWLGYTSIAVQVARSSDAGAVESAIRSAFPGRVVDIEATIGVDDTQPGQEAVGYEAKAAFAFAALTGLAAVVFVGQAIGRQVRREWADLSTLRALGLSRDQAGAAAAGSRGGDRPRRCPRRGLRRGRARRANAGGCGSAAWLHRGCRPTPWCWSSACPSSCCSRRSWRGSRSAGSAAAGTPRANARGWPGCRPVRSFRPRAWRAWTWP